MSCGVKWSTPAAFHSEWIHSLADTTDEINQTSGQKSKLLLRVAPSNLKLRWNKASGSYPQRKTENITVRIILNDIMARKLNVKTMVKKKPGFNKYSQNFNRVSAYSKQWSSVFLCNKITLVSLKLSLIKSAVHQPRVKRISGWGKKLSRGDFFHIFVISKNKTLRQSDYITQAITEDVKNEWSQNLLFGKPDKNSKWNEKGQQ